VHPAPTLGESREDHELSVYEGKGVYFLIALAFMNSTGVIGSGCCISLKGTWVQDIGNGVYGSYPL